MAYTMLQASYFMEIWLTPALGFDYAERQGAVLRRRHEPDQLDLLPDVARAAAAAVSEPAARNMVVELGGPQALSPREVVRMFEAAGAGEIATENVPRIGARVADERRQRSASKVVRRPDAPVRGGDAIDTTTSRRLFPFQMTSVRDYITAQLGAGG